MTILEYVLKTCSKPRGYSDEETELLYCPHDFIEKAKNIYCKQNCHTCWRREMNMTWIEEENEI